MKLARVFILTSLCLGTLVASMPLPASAHVERGLQARILRDTVVVDDSIQMITGTIRVSNSKPRPPYRSDFIRCGLVVYASDGRDITGGQATDGGWHASGSVARGGSRRLAFQVTYFYGETPWYMGIRHCHTPLT
jgi:hypothetical protein